MEAKAVIINKDSIEHKIGVQIHQLSVNFINALAADILLSIFDLTNKGINAYNRPFIPYSKNYRLKRIEEKLGVTPNMQFTSTMLNSIIVKKSDWHSFQIGPHGSHKKISNSFKLAMLQERKNYVIIAWSGYYRNLLAKHLERYQQQFSKIRF